ncbi:conserved exported hypothetical protein [Burkholderiales bacterium 8X]|nr:conserved exported hypothetical protein [Burkholderiales bacterium 8X]
MKKLLVALAAGAACLLSATVSAQPHGPRGPGMEPHRPGSMHRPHRRHKVWVPAHREHGRMVRGHYVWR